MGQEADQTSTSNAELQSTIGALKKQLEALTDRVAESERTHTMLLKTIRHYEKQYKRSMMPKGKFYGIEFT